MNMADQDAYEQAGGRLSDFDLTIELVYPPYMSVIIFHYQPSTIIGETTTLAD